MATTGDIIDNVSLPSYASVEELYTAASLARRRRDSQRSHVVPTILFGGSILPRSCTLSEAGLFNNVEVQALFRRSMLVSGGQDGSVKMWDMATGRASATFTSDLVGCGEVLTLAVSQDVSLLAAAGLLGNLWLWDVAEGALLHQIRCGHGPVWSLAFSEDSRGIGAACEDGHVVFYNVCTGTCTSRILLDSEGAVACISFSKIDGIIAAAKGRFAELRDLHRRRLVQRFRGHWDTINCVRFSPDERWLATASDDNTARVWDVESGEAVRILMGHLGIVSSLSFSGDARRLVTASHDMTARVWSMESGECERVLSGHSDSLKSVVFGAAGDTIATGSSDSCIRIWDAETAECAGILADHEGIVYAVAWA